MTDSTNSNSAPRKRRKLSSESSRPDRSFPVTKVRSDAPEEPEVAADLPDLAGLSGHWEDSIWGPLDSRLSLDPDSDGQQYSLELLQHLRSSSAVRSLVAAPLFSACLSVATGSPHEGHEETRELEEAQAAEFRVARWSQRRLLSLAESERRAAAPGNREDPRDAEEEERDREERMKRLERLRAALAGVSFAGEKAPLLEKAASGEEVLRFSAMFQPLGVPARRVECVRKVGEAGFGESENVREANGEISEARDMKGESQKEEKEQDEEEEVEMMEWRACMEKFDGGEETDVEARQDTLVREDKGAFSMVEHWSWEEELRGITGNRQSEDLGKKHVQESVSVIDHTEEKTTELILKDVTKNHLEDDIFDDQDDFRVFTSYPSILNGCRLIFFFFVFRTMIFQHLFSVRNSSSLNWDILILFFKFIHENFTKQTQQVLNHAHRTNSCFYSFIVTQEFPRNGLERLLI